MGGVLVHDPRSIDTLAADAYIARMQILISGSSIAGPALAFWMRRYGAETAPENGTEMKPDGTLSQESRGRVAACSHCSRSFVRVGRSRLRSAKRIGGERLYELVRASSEVAIAEVRACGCGGLLARRVVEGAADCEDE
jgi:hypothetical protein